MRSAEQYGVGDKILDCLTFDVTKNPLRRGGWLDAIITDPPCRSGPWFGISGWQALDGVRAGAKRLGKRESKGRPTREDAFVLPDGSLAHMWVSSCLIPFPPPFPIYCFTTLSSSSLCEMTLTVFNTYYWFPAGWFLQATRISTSFSTLRAISPYIGPDSTRKISTSTRWSVGLLLADSNWRIWCNRYTGSWRDERAKMGRRQCTGFR